MVQQDEHNRFDKHIFRIALILFGGYWLLCAVVYPYLPERIPIHWNAQGIVDNYGSKTVVSLLLPLLPLAIYLGMTYLPRFDSYQENYQKFVGTYEVVKISIAGFMALVNGFALLAALGILANVGMALRLSLPVLFLILGSSLGRIGRNQFVGIKTAWTLGDEENWIQTHRFTGRAMMVGSGFAFLGIILPPLQGFWLMMAGVVTPLLAGIVYSYRYARRKSVGR